MVPAIGLEPITPCSSGKRSTIGATQAYLNFSAELEGFEHSEHFFKTFFCFPNRCTRPLCDNSFNH